MAKIDTCNEALAEIGADTIQSIEEPSVTARECTRWYSSALSDLLELHDWGFAIKRVPLALRVNDRPAEWAFAYAKPPFVASLIRLLPPSTGGIGAYPMWGFWPGLAWDGGPIPYVEDAATIYSSLDGAVLEHTTTTVEEAQMPALFRRAFVLELAARIAYPVRKDRQLRGDMIQLATAARAIAMADDLNRYPRRQRSYPDEVSQVRGGWPVTI